MDLPPPYYAPSAPSAPPEPQTSTGIPPSHYPSSPPPPFQGNGVTSPSSFSSSSSSSSSNSASSTPAPFQHQNSFSTPPVGVPYTAQPFYPTVPSVAPPPPLPVGAAPARPLLLSLAESYCVPLEYLRHITITFTSFQNLPKRGGSIPAMYFEITQINQTGFRTKIFHSPTYPKNPSIPCGHTFSISVPAFPHAIDPNKPLIEIKLFSSRTLLGTYCMSILHLNYKTLVPDLDPANPRAYNSPIPLPLFGNGIDSSVSDIIPNNPNPPILNLSWTVTPPVLKDLVFEGEQFGFYVAGLKLQPYDMTPSSGNIAVLVGKKPAFIFKGENTQYSSFITMFSNKLTGGVPLLRITKEFVNNIMRFSITTVQGGLIGTVSPREGRLDFPGGNFILETRAMDITGKFFLQDYEHPIQTTLTKHFSNGQPPVCVGNIKYAVAEKFSATFDWNEDGIQLLAYVAAMCIGRHAIRGSTTISSTTSLIAPF